MNDFADLIEESKKYKPCMSLSVDKESSSVELMLDTTSNYIGEWIPDEGGDICLYRDRDTNKVVGVFLPLLNPLLVVNYDGPLKINEI